MPRAEILPAAAEGTSSSGNTPHLRHPIRFLDEAEFHAQFPCRHNRNGRCRTDGASYASGASDEAACLEMDAVIQFEMWPGCRTSRRHLGVLGGNIKIPM